jgi:hypothetical protein
MTSNAKIIPESNNKIYGNLLAFLLGLGTGFVAEVLLSLCIKYILLSFCFELPLFSFSSLNNQGNIAPLKTVKRISMKFLRACDSSLGHQNALATYFE